MGEPMWWCICEACLAVGSPVLKILLLDIQYCGNSFAVSIISLCASCGRRAFLVTVTLSSIVV